MNTDKARIVNANPGELIKPGTSSVHPLFEEILKNFCQEEILKNFCQPVKSNNRQDGADLAFDSSEKERWS